MAGSSPIQQQTKSPAGQPALPAAGVFEVGADGSLRHWSSHLTELTGLSRQEARARGWDCVLPPEDREQVLAQWEAALQHGAGFSFTCRFAHRNGSTRQVRCDVEAPDEEGCRLVLVMLGDNALAVPDSSQGEPSQQQVDNLTHRLTLAVRGGGYGVWEHDFRAGRLLWDDRMIEMYGYAEIGFHSTKEEWKSRIHPEDVEAVMAYSAKLFSGASTASVVFRIFRANDGEMRWIHSDACLQYDAEGKPLLLVGINRDVTESKVSEMQLTLLQTCVSRINDIILITNAKGPVDVGPQIVYVNDAFERRTGYRRDQVIGKSPRLLSGPRTSQAEIARLDAAIARVEPARAELINYTSDGEEFWVELELVPILDSAGVCTHWVAAERDVTERKLAEQALRESKERLEALFANALNGILLANDAGSYVDANPAICGMVGYTRGELLQLCVNDLVLPEPAGTAADELFAGFLEAGRARGLVRLRRKDGSVITAEYSAVANVMPGVHLSVLSDVTDWLEAQDKVRRSEERYALTVAAVNDGLWDWHMATGALYFSPRYYQMLGYEADEFATSYDSWTAFVHPDDYPVAERRVAEAIANQEAFDIQFRMKAKAGDWHWIRSRGRGVEVDDQGKVVRLVGTHTDISESKELSERLNESHSMLAALAEQVPGVLYQYRLHPDGRTTLPYCSPGMFEMLEVEAEALRQDGSLVAARVHPEDAEAMSESIRVSAETLQPWRHEFRVLLPEQGLKWRRADARPSRLEDGSVLWHGFLTDVTEQKAAEIQRQELQAKLIQAEKMESIGLLAGGVAHDFNNMLTVILAHCDLAMRRGAGSSELMNDLMAIRDSAGRSAALTHQLLAYARKQSTTPEVLDLNEVVPSVVGFLRRLIGENIRLLWRPTPDVWAVKMDKSHLDQILTNLALNARDAIAGAGTIVIETRNVELEAADCARMADSAPGSYVRLSVSDTGKGMDSATLERIFEPFFTTKGVGQGTGLGLSTVYGTVKQNGGFLDVFSTPGAGTTFALYLPRHLGQAPSGMASPWPVAGRPQGTETILVVEDEPRLLELNVTILEQCGYQVLAASGPEEALALAASHPGRIDLLLTDMVMPTMSGRQLREILVDRIPGLLTICVSGYTSEEFSPSDSWNGEYQFLQKPFSIEELRKAVRLILDSP